MNPMRSDYCPAWSVPALPKTEDEPKEADPAAPAPAKKAKKGGKEKEKQALVCTHEVKYEDFFINIFGKTYQYQRPVLIDVVLPAKEEHVYDKNSLRKRFGWDDEELNKRPRNPQKIKSFINT